jgi:hypothetical protein
MAGGADIFASDFDVEDFAPAKPAPAPPAEAIRRKVAEGSAFQSREPLKKRSRREARVYRTGRNAQFSCKADPEVVDEFYAITEAQGWVMGQTLERAVAALTRELGREGAVKAEPARRLDQ